jgi:hypothetical protein
MLLEDTNVVTVFAAESSTTAAEQSTTDNMRLRIRSLHTTTIA